MSLELHIEEGKSTVECHINAEEVINLSLIILGVSFSIMN